MYLTNYDVVNKTPKRSKGIILQESKRTRLHWIKRRLQNWKDSPKILSNHLVMRLLPIQRIHSYSFQSVIECLGAKIVVFTPFFYRHSAVCILVIHHLPVLQSYLCLCLAISFILTNSISVYGLIQPSLELVYYFFTLASSWGIVGRVLLKSNAS